MPAATRSRGRLVRCRCTLCLLTSSEGRMIPSQDAAQHEQRDLRRRLNMNLRLDAEASIRAAAADAVARARLASGSSSSQRQQDINDPEGGRAELEDESEDDWMADAGMGHAREPQLGDENNGQAGSPSWLHLFMILVLWLSCARGLPRNCADIILSFVGKIIQKNQDPVLPQHLVTVKKRVDFDPSFVKYVICPNDDCQRVKSLALASFACEHCETSMFEEEHPTIPIRYFHHSSLIGFLRQALQHDSFERLINHWRTRRATGRIEDVMDGMAWRQDDFINNRLNLYLTVGLDWFVAFTSTNTASYTVGTVSVRIENLPPYLRNRPEYLHVACVLPGPKQCSEAGLAEAMGPLMEELRQLEDGIAVQTPGFPLARTMRARVLMAIGDLPARSKLAGFPSHSQGGEWCGHCHADSRGWVEALLRSEQPAARSPDEHRRAAFVVRANPRLRTATLQTSAATWTPLYELPYWHSVSSVPVDAMHALHLGACKRFYFTTLIEGGLLQLDRGRYPIIAEVLRSATYPRGVTQIRANFGLKSAGTPTADAWATFARYLMPIVLASHWAEELGRDDTSTFTTTNANLRGNESSYTTAVRVRALVETATDLSHVVYLAQKRSLTPNDLAQLEHSIIRHVKAMATLIHARWPVPNHHALLHLPDHIRRFGPPRAFWFYAQERLNGFLKKTMHNQRQGGELETTMMTNHALYRTVVRSMGIMGDSEEELIFQKIMAEHYVHLDSEQDEDIAARLAAAAPALSGASWAADLEPGTVRALVSLVNNTRSALDSVAVPEFSWDGMSVATLIGSDADFFPSIMVQGTVASVMATRINTPPGATFVTVRTAAAIRLGRLVSAFEHTYAQTRTGDLVRQQYALLDVFRPIAWPTGHVLGGQVAGRLGHILCSSKDPDRTVFPLTSIVDAAITATAKFVTGDEDSLLAVPMHL